MTASPTNPQTRAESLLASLAGVISARVRVSIAGDVQEIHVLATPDLHPKQVVRNVESALRAGLGLEFDRRVISVAQVSPGTALPVRKAANGKTLADGAVVEAAVPLEPSPTPPVPVVVEAERIVLLGYEASLDGTRQAVCTVRLGRAGEEFTGSGEGSSTTAGRAEAAARALFSALTAARGDDVLALYGAALIESHGRPYVLVSATALDGRQAIPLAGAATLSRSPEESAILAGLQATNRWSDLPTAMELEP